MVHVSYAALSVIDLKKKAQIERDRAILE